MAKIKNYWPKWREELMGRDRASESKLDISDPPGLETVIENQRTILKGLHWLLNKIEEQETG